MKAREDLAKDDDVLVISPHGEPKVRKRGHGVAMLVRSDKRSSERNLAEMSSPGQTSHR